MKTWRMISCAGLGAVLLCCLLSGVWIGCEKKGGLGPPATSELAISSVTATPGSIPIGGRQASIEAKIVGPDGATPKADVPVLFSSSLGTVFPAVDTTDASGMAQTTLTSGATPGTARVRILSGVEESSVDIEITETSTLTMALSLNAMPTVLDANGSSQALITATLSTVERNNPVVGAVIQFETTLGIVTESDTTDEFGVATARLTSARQNGTASVTSSCGEVSRSIDVQLLGVSLQVTANPGNLIADSMTTSTIAVAVKDAANSPIFGELCVCTSVIGVFASSGRSQGPDTVITETDVNGEVNLHLKSRQAGSDVIRARAAGATDSVLVHFTGYRFTLTPGRTEITAGGDQTQIVAELQNSLGSPVTGVVVNFATTLGSITFSGVTDGTGHVTVLLTSGSTSGTALITAHAETPEGPVSARASVYFRSTTAGSIVLSADPKVVAVGGGKPGTASLFALVLDDRQNPVANATVAFTLIRNPGNGEYINPGTALTGVDGRAATSFISGTIASDFEGIEIMATVNGTVESNVVKLTVAGAPASIAVGYDTDSFTDNENGTYALSVAAIISDANGNPVVDGTWVYFSARKPGLPPTEYPGIVKSPVQTTDGIASSQISYPASSAGDTIVLIAEAGGVEGQKVFRLLGAAGIAKSVRLEARTNSLLADGQSVTTVDALVTDIDDHPVGGAMVTFSTDLGRITYVAFTINDVTRDDYGIAHAIYTSGASSQDDIADVCGEISGAQDCIEMRLRGVSIEVNAYPDSIPADGASQSTITVVVEETTTRIPVAGSQVCFGTDLGTITGSDLTDVSGVAMALLTSGTSRGTAQVTVTFGSTLFAFETVGFTRREASQIIILSAEPDSIAVRGAGYNESATLVFEVRDDRGRPIGSDHPQRVRFTVSGIPTLAQPGPFVFPTDTLTDEFGRVSTTLNSGIKAGALEVTASIGSAVRSTPVRIAIHGGPPDQDHFSVVPRWANVPGLRHFGLIDTITAFVGDRYGNPVPAGTAVYFTTTGGIIQGSAVTNWMGAAVAMLETANPMPRKNAADPSGRHDDVSPYLDFTWPKNGDGQAVVLATTVNSAGEAIWAHTIVIFSGSSIISNVQPRDFTIDDGYSQGFTFQLSDINGNPIARSMGILDLIVVRGCDAGSVSEPFRTGILMPDTRSAGWTQFSFGLDDADPGDNKLNDPAGSTDFEGCTISIVVNNENNGDVYFSISGRID